MPLPEAGIDTPAELERVVKAFHAAHEAIFAVSEADQEIEFIQWKGRVTGELDRPPLTPLPNPTTQAPAPERRGKAYFESTGIVDIPRYRGALLTPGMQIQGPALVVEPTTTIVLYPGSVATVTPFNNYMIQV